MHTRCPNCRTVFNVLQEQLDARWGLVRCGHCDGLFYADRHFIDAAAEADAPVTATAAHALSPSEADGASAIPSFGRSSHAAPIFWRLATATAALILIGQFAYFYRDELAHRVALRPALVQYCAILGCRVQTPGVPPPELIASTVAAHPKYANALRIQVSMVNRTEMEQPYPLLEVSLTDIDGGLLARRIFTPEQYLESPRATARMPPSVALDVVLNVTNVDMRAVGYEIQSLAPDLRE